MRGPIKTQIVRDGQPYVDRPVYVERKRPSALEEAIARAFAETAPPAPRMPQRVVVAYDRQPLRWMTKDARGRLVPRAPARG